MNRSSRSAVISEQSSLTATQSATADRITIPSWPGGLATAPLTIAAISPASKGFEKTANTRADRASITSCREARSASTIVRTPRRVRWISSSSTRSSSTVVEGLVSTTSKAPERSLRSASTSPAAAVMSCPDSTGDASSAFSRYGSGSIIRMRAMGGFYRRQKQ